VPIFSSKPKVIVKRLKLQKMTDLAYMFSYVWYTGNWTDGCIHVGTRHADIPAGSDAIVTLHIKNRKQFF